MDGMDVMLETTILNLTPRHQEMSPMLVLPGLQHIPPMLEPKDGLSFYEIAEEKAGPNCPFRTCK